MGRVPGWLRLRSRQAEVYRQLDRGEEAEQIEAELLKLLAYADEDHFVAEQLRELR